MGAGEGQELHLAWHPQSDNILAVTVRDGLLLIDVDAAREGGGTDLACNQRDLQNGLRLLEMAASSSVSSTVAFSPDGQVLAAAASDGKVMCARGTPHCLDFVHTCHPCTYASVLLESLEDFV